MVLLVGGTASLGELLSRSHQQLGDFSKQTYSKSALTPNFEHFEATATQVYRQFCEFLNFRNYWISPSQPHEGKFVSILETLV